jgi:hypothetical protein
LIDIKLHWKLKKVESSDLKNPCEVVVIAMITVSNAELQVLPVYDRHLEASGQN